MWNVMFIILSFVSAGSQTLWWQWWGRSVDWSRAAQLNWVDGKRWTPKLVPLQRWWLDVRLKTRISMKTACWWLVVVAVKLKSSLVGGVGSFLLPRTRLFWYIERHIGMGRDVFFWGGAAWSEQIVIIARQFCFPRFNRGTGDGLWPIGTINFEDFLLVTGARMND